MDSVVSYWHRLQQYSARRSNRLGSLPTSKSNTPLILNEFDDVKNFSEDFVRDVLETVKTGDISKVTTYLQLGEELKNIFDKRGRNILHYATESNIPTVLNLILEHCDDIDVLDDEKNTPLHVAIMSNCVDSIKHLIMKGAKTTIYNSKGFAAIHLAAIMNHTKCLKALLAYKEVDGNIVGPQGRTALHYACKYDYYESVSVLLENGICCLNMPCYNGFYPVHEACKSGSERSLNVIIHHASKCNITKHDLMSLYDAEGNTPLHAAVQSGDVKAVKICLENGACSCQQQHDKSTPFHLACARGSLDIVKILIGNESKEKVKVCFNIVDSQEMSCLHMAAMFNHSQLASYLVEKGANLEKRDFKGRTPLLLAAVNKSWEVLETLVKLGANISAEDNDSVNVYHLMALNKGDFGPQDFFLKYQSDVKTDMLNKKDNDGCTPIHYATRWGKIKSIESLLQFGVDINSKNKEEQSPLHFAAKYGRYNTVRKLMNNTKQMFLINDTDRNGNTALHLAAENGQLKVISLLLNKGAAIIRNNNQRTPLHLAAMKGYTHSAKRLLNVHSFLLDKQDHDGNTALHLATRENKANVVKLLSDFNCKIIKNTKEMNAIDIAIEMKHVEAIQAMIMHTTRGREYMRAEVKNYESVYHALIESMPCVMMKLLDNSISNNTGVKIDASNFYIKYDFCCLEGDYKTTPDNPLPILNAMVKYKRETLLSHSLCKKYLVSKWMSYGMVCTFLGLLLYAVFLISLTTFVMLILNKERMNNSSIYEQFERQSLMTASSMNLRILQIILFCGVVCNYLKEIAQMIHQKFKYLMDPVNYIEMTLYLLTPIVLVSSEDYLNGDKDLFLILSAIALFIAWFVSLLYLQRFNGIGLYIVMFLQIMTTLAKVILIFSIVIIAFSFSFHVLLGNTEILGPEKGFFTMYFSIHRVFAMMLGELDFLGSFIKPYIQSDFEHFLQFRVAMAFFTLFGILVPVLLINLLIGLAVGDIETVRRNALLKTLAMQVEIHTDLEQRLPKALLKRVCKEELIIYPNLNRPNKIGKKFLFKTIGSLIANSIFEREKEASHEAIQVEIIQDNLERQRVKLKELSNMIFAQYELTRMIVQKMEITTEQDNLDEGDEICDF